MSAEIQPTQGMDVVQTDARYAGPVLGGRYQVLASAIGPTFYVYDLKVRDQVRTEHGDIRRFQTIFAAVEFLGFTDLEEETRKFSPAIIAGFKQEIDMAKAAKVSEAMAKAQASMTARIAKKNAAATEEGKDAKKAVAKKATAKAPALKVVPKAEPAPTAPRKGRSVTTTGTLSARARELVVAGKTNEDGMAALRKEFEKVPGNAMSYHRAKLGM